MQRSEEKRKRKEREKNFHITWLLQGLLLFLLYWNLFLALVARLSNHSIEKVLV
jgi:hypothetical protein